MGTEHDHLAMRHIDDAHHTERDGEPDRGQQQHAAETDALEQIGDDSDELEARAASVALRISGPVCGSARTRSSRLWTCGSVEPANA
jgi:hypothetical protein